MTMTLTGRYRKVRHQHLIQDPQQITLPKIVFEGCVKNATRNLRNKGDIAVDDISMLSCHDCDNPTPKHATADSTNFTFGSEVEIKCDKGYNLTGKSKMVCQAGGSWSVSRPTCNLYDCGNRTILNGKFFASNGTTYGQTASQICNNGYRIVGNTDVVCTETGWNGTVATCNIVDCGDPTPEHAISNASNFEYGSVIKLTCVNGYSLIGESTIVCQANGSWSAIQPTCKPYECGNRTISHGKFIALEGTTFGQTATYVCDTGYTLTRETTVTCAASGWDDIAATCVIVDDAENSVLIAVYVLIPVLFILAMVCTGYIVRRRYPKCKKLTDAKKESRNNPKFQLNNTMNKAAPKSENHTNQHRNYASYDNATKTDDRSATIDTSDNIYNIIGAKQMLEKNDGNNYDHIHNLGNVQFVNESYSHLPGSSKTVKCQLEHEDPDYDHALAGGPDTVAPEDYDYSHLNDAIKNKIYSPSNSDHEYASVNKILKNKERTVEKSTAGYEETWR